MEYVIYVPLGGYVCKGSFVVEGEVFKVLGSIENARKFKTEKAAENERERLVGKYANIDYSSRVVSSLPRFQLKGETE